QMNTLSLHDALPISLGIFEVSADGGEPSVLVRPDGEKGELAFQGPQILPDGGTLLYTELRVGQNWNSAHVVVRNLRTGETRVLRSEEHTSELQSREK